MPTKVLDSAWVARSHDLACIRGQVEEGIPKDSPGMVACGKLGYGVMHVLVLLVFDFQGNDGQAVKEEDEVYLLIRLAKVEMWTEGEAVFGVLLHGNTLGRARLRVVETKLQPPNLETTPQDHPERRMLKFPPQSPEYLFPRVSPIVVREFSERVGLGGPKEFPEMLLNDTVFRIGNIGLFEHAVFVLANQIVGDMLLKRQLRGLLTWHQTASSRCSSRARTRRTASRNFCSNAALGKDFIAAHFGVEVSF